MIHDVPFVLEIVTALAVSFLIVVSAWPPATNLAVRLPVLSASVLFFGFLFATAVLARMLDSISLMLIVSMLIFLGSISIFLLMAPLGDDDTSEDEEQKS